MKFFFTFQSFCSTKKTIVFGSKRRDSSIISIRTIYSPQVFKYGIFSERKKLTCLILDSDETIKVFGDAEIKPFKHALSACFLLPPRIILRL